MESDKTQLACMLLPGGGLCQLDFTVTQDIFRKSPFPFDELELQVLLRPYNEESLKPIDSVKFRKGVVATVKDVEGTISAIAFASFTEAVVMW